MKFDCKIKPLSFQRQPHDTIRGQIPPAVESNRIFRKNIRKPILLLLYKYGEFHIFTFDFRKHRKFDYRNRREMSQGLNRDYQVCEEIGRGRFGTVFRCFSPESGDFFACKSIDKRLLSDSVDRECLEKEAKIMQLVRGNPNVVRIYDVYEDETDLHMVMELCDSSDLYDRVSKRIFSEAEAAAVMSPLMEAIGHCHRQGVCHRDIKPENVLFDGKSRLKLGDFGSADFFHDGEVMRGIVGTPYYVAPEVLSGRDYNEKVDVWSAGVILYIMLAGVPPFYGESAAEIFEAVLRGNLRFPTRIFHSVSPVAKDLLRRMLCKDVSRRFSAEQVLSHPWITSRGEASSMVDLT